MDEASAGDKVAAAQRMAIVDTLSLLEITPEVTELGAEIIRAGGMPSKAQVDALHVAVAAVNGCDFLLTWNCKHIANAALRDRLENICRSSGFEPPIICTPMELNTE